MDSCLTLSLSLPLSLCRASEVNSSQHPTRKDHPLLAGSQQGMSWNYPHKTIPYGFLQANPLVHSQNPESFPTYRTSKIQGKLSAVRERHSSGNHLYRSLHCCLIVSLPLIDQLSLGHEDQRLGPARDPAEHRRQQPGEEVSPHPVSERRVWFCLGFSAGFSLGLPRGVSLEGEPIRER